MNAFLIEVDDTKEGVCYPTVIGPFPDDAAAEAFAEHWGLGTAAEGGQGGYSSYHVISADTAMTPERYAERYAWKRDYLDEEKR